MMEDDAAPVPQHHQHHERWSSDEGMDDDRWMGAAGAQSGDDSDNAYDGAENIQDHSFSNYNEHREEDAQNKNALWLEESRAMENLPLIEDPYSDDEFMRSLDNVEVNEKEDFKSFLAALLVSDCAALTSGQGMDYKDLVFLLRQTYFQFNQESTDAFVKRVYDMENLRYFLENNSDIARVHGDRILHVDSERNRMLVEDAIAASRNRTEKMARNDAKKDARVNNPALQRQYMEGRNTLFRVVHCLLNDPEHEYARKPDAYRNIPAKDGSDGKIRAVLYGYVQLEYEKKHGRILNSDEVKRLSGRSKMSKAIDEGPQCYRTTFRIATDDLASGTNGKQYMGLLPNQGLLSEEQMKEDLKNFQPLKPPEPTYAAHVNRRTPYDYQAAKRARNDGKPICDASPAVACSGGYKEPSTGGHGFGNARSAFGAPPDPEMADQADSDDDRDSIGSYYEQFYPSDTPEETRKKAEMNKRKQAHKGENAGKMPTPPVLPDETTTTQQQPTTSQPAAKTASSGATSQSAFAQMTNQPVDGGGNANDNQWDSEDVSPPAGNKNHSASNLPPVAAPSQPVQQEQPPQHMQPFAPPPPPVASVPPPQAAPPPQQYAPPPPVKQTPTPSPAASSQFYPIANQGWTQDPNQQQVQPNQQWPPQQQQQPGYGIVGGAPPQSSAYPPSPNQQQQQPPQGQYPPPGGAPPYGQYPPVQGYPPNQGQPGGRGGPMAGGPGGPMAGGPGGPMSGGPGGPMPPPPNSQYPPQQQQQQPSYPQGPPPVDQYGQPLQYPPQQPYNPHYQGIPPQQWQNQPPQQPWMQGGYWQGLGNGPAPPQQPPGPYGPPPPPPPQQQQQQPGRYLGGTPGEGYGNHEGGGYGPERNESHYAQIGPLANRDGRRDEGGQSAPSHYTTAAPYSRNHSAAPMSGYGPVRDGPGSGRESREPRGDGWERNRPSREHAMPHDMNRRSHGIDSSPNGHSTPTDRSMDDDFRALSVEDRRERERERPRMGQRSNYHDEPSRPTSSRPPTSAFSAPRSRHRIEDLPNMYRPRNDVERLYCAILHTAILHHGSGAPLYVSVAQSSREFNLEMALKVLYGDEYGYYQATLGRDRMLADVCEEMADKGWLTLVASEGKSRITLGPAFNDME